MSPASTIYTLETARAALSKMGATILFEKVLTSSDVNGTGRLVIPKSHAEAHFPSLEAQQGMALRLVDPEGNKHSFRFRFWLNNQSSRMYLLENTAGVQAQYQMAVGDVLVFGQMDDGRYVVCGRRGTKADVSRRPAVRRPRDEAGATGKRSRARASGAPRSAGARQKAASQAVQGMYSYWSATSLPVQRDGVFRAMLCSPAQEGDRVLAQCGAWSAVVALDGELFQAFFDTMEAASAALQAALQTQQPVPPAPTPSPRGTPAAADPPGGAPASRGASAEPAAAAAAVPAAGAAAGTEPAGAVQGSAADPAAAPAAAAAAAPAAPHANSMKQEPQAAAQQRQRAPPAQQQQQQQQQQQAPLLPIVA